jgi:hypothetical protein
MYILSTLTIKAIAETQRLRSKLSLVLDLSEQSIYRIYSNNEVNNDLTKLAALDVIEEETGFQQKKIVEKVKDNVAAK